MPKILPQIQNIVVVMFENRSLDNLCGWLYSDPSNQPSLYLPANSPAAYDGLNKNLWNPSNASYFQGQPPDRIFVQQGTVNYQIPDPDPEEEFDHVTYQLYGSQTADPNPQFPMQGFVVDYGNRLLSDPRQIMQTYTPNQLPVLSALAQSYAISDAWFCSVPTQTLANRAFVHSGTSNGILDNGLIPDPFDFDGPTIFNVLSKMGVGWTVYSDATVVPSLTRTYAPWLWDDSFDDHFQGFDAFQTACANNSLPQYSFLEPRFLVDPNDQHPPHDVGAGDQFLYQIWQAVSQSPAWNHILLVIMYDEHGGCYDHVLPPTGAITPDIRSDPGKEGFRFDRFGVRIPMVVVSPYVQAGTVFRSDTAVPYDHTSILATLRDWLTIPDSLKLTSARIAAAPNLNQVLTLSTPRVDKPTITPRPTALAQTPLTLPINSLQKSLVTGAARRLTLDPRMLLDRIPTRQHAADFFQQSGLRAQK
jgi:phospholipase C